MIDQERFNKDSIKSESSCIMQSFENLIFNICISHYSLLYKIVFLTKLYSWRGIEYFFKFWVVINNIS